MSYNTFSEFCENIGFERNFEGVDKTLESTDSKLMTFIENMKQYAKRFDSLALTFIQRAFDNSNDVSQKITSVYPDGEIPDEIINTISLKLFEKAYSDPELGSLNRKIINALSVYYVISIN